MAKRTSTLRALTLQVGSNAGDISLRESYHPHLSNNEGQQEYYITHHIFLSNRSLYVLAFDIAKYRPEVGHSCFSDNSDKFFDILTDMYLYIYIYDKTKIEGFGASNSLLVVWYSEPCLRPRSHSHITEGHPRGHTC